MRVNPKTSFRELSEIDKARLGMAIDTDGCISISFFNPRKYAYPSFQFIGYSALPVKLAELYGGTISELRPGVFRWLIVAHEELGDFLAATQPYVMLKKEQVRIALEMLCLLREKPSNWKQETLRLAKELSHSNSAYKHPKIALEELSHGR